MLGLLPKGRHFFKTVVVCCQTSLPFSSKSNVRLKFQTWSNMSAKVLSFGAGSVVLAGVILAQTARDSSPPGEEKGSERDITENNTRTRGGRTGKDKGQNLTERKTERKTLKDAIVESRDLLQRIKVHSRPSCCREHTYSI